MREHCGAVNIVTLVVVGLILGALLRLQPISGANDRSRWSTVWSLNSGNGYVIDETPYPTIDKVRRNGHFYSSKPALLPTLIAGVVWIIRMSTGMMLPADEAIIVRFTLILINIVPLAGFVLLYARLLRRMGYEQHTLLFCVCTAAFGTYLTAYSVTLNNHTVAAYAVFFALYCFIRILYEDQRHWKYFFFCGLSSAWAVANEMVAMLLATILMVWLGRKFPRETLSFFLPPAILVGVAFLITTYLSTGGLVPYYLYFDTPLYKYEGSYWSNPQGIDAANDPKWLYLFNFVLGHHGILSLTPVFMLSFYGFFVKSRLQGIQNLGWILTLTMILFYTFKTNNYGGHCQGPRWLFWLIPFWLITLAPVVERYLSSRPRRLFTYGLFLVSLLSVGFALSGNRAFSEPGPWSSAWLHLFMRSVGWVDY